MVSERLPLPYLFFQPKPWASISPPSGSTPTYLPGSAAPWALPNVWPAGNQSDRLFIVHPHAAESLAYGVSGRLRIGIAARALRVHVDQAHLRSAERMMQFSFRIAPVGGEPLALRSPVHFRGFPGIDTATSETEGLEAHGLHGDVTREDQQIGPGDLAAVLLLDGPQPIAWLFPGWRYRANC